MGVPADIPEGTRKIIQIASREIGVFNIKGEFHALLNVCPHRGAPLCTGRLRPRVEYQGSEFVYSENDQVLKCPWHQWEFSVKTGEALDGDLVASTYDITVEEGRLVLYF